MRRTRFYKLPGGRQVWLESLPAGETPLFPHPEGRRWGVNRQEDNGEVLIYLGRLHLIWTPPQPAAA